MNFINKILIFVGIFILSNADILNSKSTSKHDKIELKIKKLENNLEYVKTLQENIDFIDQTWQYHMNIIKREFSNTYINKQQIINNVLGYETYSKLQEDYSQKYLHDIIDKYCDIIHKISENEIFINNIFVNITLDSDGENIKQKLINKIFLNGEFFTNSQLRTNLEKLKSFDIFPNRKNIFDYDFFDKNYILFIESSSLIVNKIYLFKLQNQIELKKISKSYSTNNYNSLKNNILNQIYELTNIQIEQLSKNII